MINDSQPTIIDGYLEKVLIKNLQADEPIASSSAEILRLFESFLTIPRKTALLQSLVVLAAFRVTSDIFRCVPRPAEQQTGVVGDIEVMLANEDRICTIYEMKQKAVTIGDLDRAVQKLAGRADRIDNYVVITSDRIGTAVSEYAATLYDATGGTEFVVLDCLGFVRHFLHLFHRRRGAFLDAYQSLLLDQPDSAVGPPLKRLFLNLRELAMPRDQ